MSAARAAKHKPVVVDEPPKVTPLITTLAARIVDLVRREDFPAGHRLTEQSLVDALGVSRSPVRKALQVLAQQGVVRSEPNRGYQLALPSAGLQPLALDEAESEEAIYLRIASDRIHGELPQEVTESELMERYGVSRIQVQRLLNRMGREAMVERKPGRGWIFRPLMNDLQSHRESYRFRMIIEPAAILEPGYAVDLAELEKCRREQQQLLQGGVMGCTPADIFQAGVHFHETMIAGAHNRFLVDSLRTINQMRRVVEYGTRLDAARLERQCRDHLVLIDLLARNERMEASQFLRQHLNTARLTKLGNE
ncbi:GntR family transcriptional regulator [Ramlibacter sp. G-1-2-2]|uniref:GntR family transcriptional regulator n=1 Tax=Ramlibacter agri TaxID=2728837 RepID=A0A848H8U8_9BURK|nr:GntR family transcriptional regulator [Ramlibacter agri]NML44078.1 GntR family transcriptional regulator [Ramlibacter agri]